MYNVCMYVDELYIRPRDCDNEFRANWNFITCFCYVSVIYVLLEFQLPIADVYAFVYASGVDFTSQLFTKTCIIACKQYVIFFFDFGDPAICTLGARWESPGCDSQ